MGGSSGGGGHTPYEAPDSLKSAQRLRAMGLISLGPIRGAVTPDKYQSAFFDNTPLKNAQGEWNYQNTEINYNLGTQDQLPLEGFEMSEREVPVSAEVKFDHILSRSVIDPDVTRLRISIGVNALFEQNDQGDTNGTSVSLQFLINNRPVQDVTIDGKSSSRFHRSYILDNLPPVPFTITVKRLTADSKSQRLQNSTFWSSYTEIIDTKLSYPNMAMVGIKTDSRYNPNFPNINFLLYGRLVKVPSNYDPYTRTYATGLWKGDFKLDWSNNPAWVFYDLVTNKLAGLGQRLGDYGVDKFQLYQIAQYCDQLVPDGYGGFEPRMTANLWITEQREAYQVISDMASVFRAIAVWNGVQYTAIQDRPSDPVCTYTQANVIEGKFNRQYAPLKSIFTAVEVEFADENNFYQKAIEYVADDSMIERYGYNVKKIVAFACTSRGQARRYGKWVLETSRLEQCTINFSVGRDGLQIIPGDIIEVADKSYANLNLGGRVIAVSGRQVTLDAPIETEGESYLSYLGEDKRLVRRKISQIDRQNKALVTLDVEPVGLNPMDLWTLHSPLVSTQRYRVLTIAENDNGSYTITALQHVPQKETIVDDGAVFEPSTESLHQVPSQLTYVGVEGTHSGGMRIAWESSSANGILTYDIKVIKDGSLYLFKKGESSNTLALDDLPDGEYLVTIIARNQQGQIVSEKTESFTIARPPLPKNVSVMGGLSEISLAWDYVDNITQTEIWASETNDIHTAKRIAKVLASFYSHAVGARQTRYYWLRHTRGQNVGDFYQQQGLQAETGADIDEELRLLNEKLSEPIINQVFDVAAPARQLEMIKVVPSITNKSQFLGYTLIKSQDDNRLYKWNGRSYEYNTPASEIEGKILPAQLAEIPTSKLSGQLSDSQIQAINAAKLTGMVAVERIPNIPSSKLSGSITTAQLPAVPTTKLTGTLSASQIAVNTIGANHIQANAITADKISSNAVSTQKLTANAVTVDKIATNAISADKIQSNAVTTTKIASGSVDTSKLTANAVQARNIAAGSIIADKIASNAVTTTKLSANAVTAAKLSANSVGANHIQANAVVAGKIAANAIQAGNIQAGAINANHLQAGQISTDKLAVGLGGNLLYNPIFANNGEGWRLYVDDSNMPNTGWSFNRSTGDYQGDAYLDTENQFRWQEIRKNTNHNARLGGLYQDMKLAKGKYYVFSAYVGGHRSYIDLNLEGGSTEHIFKSWSGRGTMGGYGSGSTKSTGIEEERRIFIVFKANGNVDSNYRLIINMWAYGSEQNAFIAIRRPMLEECTVHARKPSAWVNAGITAIHGGSIKTRTITAQQIAANTITSNEIVANAINAKHIATGTINAQHIHTRAISADKLNIQSLSAISANLGTVTAGTIRGATISGNTITGNTVSGGSITGTTISGTTINGGYISGTNISGVTIRGSHLEGATGSFTGTLTVGQLIGSNVLEVVTLNNVQYSTETRGPKDNRKRYGIYSREINIKPAPIDRFFTILNGDTTEIIPANQRKVIRYRKEIEHSNGGERPPEIQHDSSIRMTVLLIAMTSPKTVS